MPIAAIGGLVSGVGSVIGGITGASAASDAAAAQQAAAMKAAGMATDAAKSAQAGEAAAVTGANQTVQSTLAGQQAGLNPYQTAGTTGIGMLNQAVNPGGSLAGTFAFDPSNIQNDPGYQFQMNEGLKALQRSAASQGLLTSGGTGKSMMNYAQGLAGTEFGNAYNRALTTYQTNRTNSLQNIQQLLGLGQFGTQLSTAAQQNAGNLQSGNTMQGALASGQFGMQGAQIAGQDITGAGNAQAAGIVGSTNAYNSILPGISNAVSGYNMQQMLNQPAANPFQYTPPPPSAYSGAPQFSMGTPPAGSVPPWMMPGGSAPSYGSSMAGGL